MEQGFYLNKILWRMYCMLLDFFRVSNSPTTQEVSPNPDKISLEVSKVVHDFLPQFEHGEIRLFFEQNKLAIEQFAVLVEKSKLSPFSYYLQLFNPVLKLFSPLNILFFLIRSASATWISHGGIPEAGKDLCSGISWCGQGYTLDNTTTNTMQISRFTENLQSKIDAGSFWQLNDCITIAHVTDILSKFLNEHPLLNGTTSDCSWSSNVLFGSKVSGTVTQLPETMCLALQNYLTSNTNPCINTGAAVGKNFAIAGIAIGGTLVLMALCTGVYCTIKHRNAIQDKCCI